MAAGTLMGDATASERDLRALQGNWQQIAFEENGIASPPDSYGAPDALTTIDGHHFSVRTASGQLLLEGSFTLDATAAPRAINWIDAMGSDKNKQLLASYLLDGDRFVFIAADAGLPRPTELHTGPGQTMRTFARRR